MDSSPWQKVPSGVISEHRRAAHWYDFILYLYRSSILVVYSNKLSTHFTDYSIILIFWKLAFIGLNRSRKSAIICQQT